MKQPGVRCVTIAALSCCILLAGSNPAQAQTSGPCAAAINGQRVESHTASSDALAIDSAIDVQFVVATAPTDEIRFARIDLEFDPFRWTVVEQEVDGSTWVGSFDLGDQARYGVGLYRAVASAQLASGANCTAAAWFRVTGRSPLTTIAGAGGAFLLVLGVLLQVAGIVRAVQSRGGLGLALAGGIPTGIGAILLAQQFGAQALAADSIVLWVAAPAAAGAIGQRIAGRRSLPKRAPAPPPEWRPPPAPSPPAPDTQTAAPPPPGPEAKTAAAEPSAGDGPDRVGSTASPAAMGAAVDAISQPDETDLPRTAYARLDAPDVVVAAREFELVVGLSDTPSPDVIGEPLLRPPTSKGPYTLSIHVVADGFTLRDGESWRVQLPVTHEQPYPSTSLHLTALPGAENIKARSIRALFSVDGQTMGMAFRSVVVALTTAVLDEAERQPQEAGVDLSIPTTWTAPDLTVRILEGESEGRLMWTFESPHAGVDLPDEPADSELGEAEDPKSFARQLVDRVNAREGKPGLYQYLVGVGRTIAEEMPEQFWTTLTAVAGVVQGHPPSVLILSEEPYIPWELAVVEPPIDPQAPPFLSAQTEIGRWVLGHRRPRLPPPVTAQVNAIAVISGVYERPGWARLVQAEEEAAQLAQAYGAVEVNASAQEVLDCLSGSPPADLMHFAVHGVYDPAGLEDGVVLVDGHALDPMEIKGSTFTTTPFVFLNACQVGSGNKILGDHAGLAAAFLWSGACGVVAPLWSIKDTVAKEVAIRFYAQAFEGATIGTVLRKERAAFKPTESSLSATYLAYQYFGHPGMKISRGSGNGRG